MTDIWSEQFVAGFNREHAIIGQIPENLIGVVMEKWHIDPPNVGFL